MMWCGGGGHNGYGAAHGSERSGFRRPTAFIRIRNRNRNRSRTVDSPHGAGWRRQPWFRPLYRVIWVSGLQRSNCENDFNFNFNFKRGLWVMAKFDPERMAVYRLAREHTRAVHMLTDTVPARGFADLINQLRRAAASIPANVLEAAGEWRVGKRLNYLMIAKGSTCECWAHTDSLVDSALCVPMRSRMSGICKARSRAC
jgi:four helix bundle protein